MALSILLCIVELFTDGTSDVVIDEKQGTPGYDPGIAIGTPLKREEEANTLISVFSVCSGSLYHIISYHIVGNNDKRKFEFDTIPHWK
jgi:hypothetical protein